MGSQKLAKRSDVKLKKAEKLASSESEKNAESRRQLSTLEEELEGADVLENRFQSWREETEVVLKDYMEENSLLKKGAEEAEGKERDLVQQVATLKHQLEKGDRE